jgi:hypothetical protein
MFSLNIQVIYTSFSTTIVVFRRIGLLIAEKSAVIIINAENIIAVMNKFSGAC